MSKDVHSNNVKESCLVPILDGDKLNVEMTAEHTAKLLLGDSLLVQSDSKSKKVYKERLMVTVQNMDSQLKKYTGQDQVLSQKFEEALKASIEKDSHENKLLDMFSKAEASGTHRFHNKMSSEQLENKIYTANDGHHIVEHSLLTLVKAQRNRSLDLHKAVSKLNPFAWLDNKCEQFMYSWLIIQCEK